MSLEYIRADDGIRTRDPHLGKVMLYQLSHFRPFLVRCARRNGAEGQIRTDDTRLFRAVLYRLSYLGADVAEASSAPFQTVRHQAVARIPMRSPPRNFPGL